MTSVVNLVTTGLLLGIIWIILIPILSGDVVLVNRRYEHQLKYILFTFTHHHQISLANFG